MPTCVETREPIEEIPFTVTLCLVHIKIMLVSLQVVVQILIGCVTFLCLQVLPDRTHPTMNMNGSSGYLLTGITIKTTTE